MTRAPLLPLALAFASGIALGLALAPPAWLLPAGALLLALAGLAARRGRLLAATGAVLALLVLAGWGRVALPDPFPLSRGLRAGPLVLEGIVSGDPEPEGGRTRLPLALVATAGPEGRAPASGALAVAVYGRPPVVAAGDRVRVAATVTAPRPFLNPGSRDLALPGAARRMRWLAAARSDGVERLEPGDPAPWWLRARLAVRRTLRAHLPPVSAALLEGLLIGERRQLPPGLLADFRRAGVFHVLAISGFNVALVAGAVLGVLRLAGLGPRLAAAGALAALGAFAAVVGPQPSVLRATVMGGLFLLALVVRRETVAWNSLAAALLLLLALDPASLAEPGFQLSFAATAGILHLGLPLQRALGRGLPRVLALPLGISLGAQAGVTPVAAAWFGQLSLAGVPANLAVVPLAGALTLLGLVALAVTVVAETAGHLVFQSLWVLLLALRLLVRAFAAVPGAMIPVPAPPALALAAAAGALVAAPLARGRRGRALALALGAAAVLLTAWSARPDGWVHLWVLDVGQGEALLVRGPDGRALLVDTGGGGPGRVDRGEFVVLPALRRLGVTRLDAIAVTHGDPDHAGGLAGLLANLPVGEVWVPAGPEGEAWRAPLAAAGVARRPLGRGDRVWLGPLLVTALHPPAAGAGTPEASPRSANDRSLVLRVAWGLFAAVLAADAGGPVERELVAAGVPLAAPVLKVGHHGSRQASGAGFLASVGPRVAAISVGARNPFGHPDPAVVGRLARAGARVLRTDEDGAIEVASDGARLRVRRFTAPGTVEETALGGAP